MTKYRCRWCKDTGHVALLISSVPCTDCPPEVLRTYDAWYTPEDVARAVTRFRVRTDPATQLDRLAKS